MSSIEHHRFYSLMTCLSIFIFALQVPRLMYLSVIFLLAIASVKWLESERMRADFILSFICLFAFVYSYYSKTLYFGYTPIEIVIRYSLIICSMYIIGAALPTNTNNATSLILALVFGFIFFSLLTTAKHYSAGDIFDTEYLKAAPNFWSGGDPINRPGLGALASLGMCLLPILLSPVVSIVDVRINKQILFLVISILIGFYVNLLLANRAPFISVLIAFLVVFTYWYLIDMVSLKKIIIILCSFALITYSIYIYFDFENLYVASRLIDEGFSTAGRSDAWLLMLNNLLTETEGGHVVRLGGLSFVHNLWLDVAWDAGIYPFIFLIVFHALHIKPMLTILKNKSNVLASTVILCVFVSFFSNFMQEPTMAASGIYFAGSCFFLGIVNNLGRIYSL